MRRGRQAWAGCRTSPAHEQGPSQQTTHVRAIARQQEHSCLLVGTTAHEV